MVLSKKNRNFVAIKTSKYDEPWFLDVHQRHNQWRIYIWRSSKLDDYAEQFSTGKILYKRFSPSEQLGCVKGGTIHVIASLLAGAEVGTDQLSAPEHSFIREQQLGKIQEKRISHDWSNQEKRIDIKQKKAAREIMLLF